MTQFEDHSSGTLPIAYRTYVAGPDSAGQPALFLLHGAVRNLEDWHRAAPLLTDQFQVIAVDLRGHGLSGTGPWGWDDICGDIAALADQLAVGPHLVAGHSLGGMAAAHYGATIGQAHGCIGTLNLDGHGSGNPALYAGLSADIARTRIEEISKLSRETVAAGNQPVDDDTRTQILDSITQQVPDAHDAALYAAVLQRMLHRGEDRLWHFAPDATTYDAMQTTLDSDDLLAAYEATQVPLLIVKTTRQETNNAAAHLPWIAETMAAYHKGLHAALTDMAASNDLVSFAEMPTGHSLQIEDPAGTAALIRDFAARL